MVVYFNYFYINFSVQLLSVSAFINFLPQGTFNANSFLE